MNQVKIEKSKSHRVQRLRDPMALLLYEANRYVKGALCACHLPLTYPKKNIIEARG